MTFYGALVVIGTLQGAFLLLLVVFLTIRRSYDRRQRAAFVAARGAIAAPLRAWLVGGGHAAPVVQAIRALPRGTAIGYVSLLARQTIPVAQRGELAEALRGEAWIERAVGQHASRLWWRRLEAARAIALLGEARHRAALEALVDDPHPAVQVAALSAIPGLADPSLVGRVLDRHARFPKVVRQYLVQALRPARGIAGPALAERIRAGRDVPELTAWVTLADQLDEPLAVRAALGHAAHAHEGVRRTVARALRRHPGPDARDALHAFLADPSAQVRAAAARTLGELGAATSVSHLAPLLSDRAWIVRLRAALALAQLGERGRAVLRAVREGEDRFAADMARLVSGLSDGALLELGDA